MRFYMLQNANMKRKINSTVYNTEKGGRVKEGRSWDSILRQRSYNFGEPSEEMGR